MTDIPGGQPGQADGTPASAGGNPNQTGGNPNQTGGNPNEAGGNPNQAVANSNEAGGNSNQPADDGASEAVNLTIVWFLGLALLALVGTLIGFSVSKTTFPDGLTSLASLIAGGLLGIVNPTRALSKQRSTSGNTPRTLLGRRPSG
jgi:hypothetical protein